MKGFAIFVAVLVVSAACAVAGGMFLWRTFQEPVKAELQRLGEDVTQFAATHEQSDCAPEAFGRLAACDGGMWCSLQAPIFTKMCLRKARRSPGLCDEVPKSLVQSVIWPSEECAGLDVDPELCTRILGEVVKACANRP